MASVVLRDVADGDLPVFFVHQQDLTAAHMAAFTAKDPADRAAFDAHWARIRASDSVIIQSIVLDGEVAGHVLCFEEDGRTEISYWIGREHWGRGIASEALKRFLEHVTRRPLHARVAKDNAGSVRVLEKCGFTIVSEDRGFANARGAEVEEFIMKLAPKGDTGSTD